MTDPIPLPTPLRLALQVLILVLLALATTPARAEFMGAGTIFGAANCSWPTGVEMTRARYRAVETDGGRSSSITLNFAVGGVNTYNIYGAAAPSRAWRRAAGRSIWGALNNMGTRPLVRVLLRQTGTFTGPADMDTAQDIYLRLRIRNFNGEPGCAVTVGLMLNRVN